MHQHKPSYWFVCIEFKIPILYGLKDKVSVMITIQPSKMGQILCEKRNFCKLGYTTYKSVK